MKTATRRFPLKLLSEIELESRDDRRGLVRVDEDGFPKLLAFVWMARNRR